VKKLTRLGHVVHAASPDEPLLLNYKLARSRDLGFKRAQLEHTHDTAACAGGAP